MPEFHSRFEKIDRRVPIDEHNCAVQFDVTKCKNCTLCRRACADTQTVLDYYSLSSTGDMPICVHCGQCSSACPFGAIVEVNDVDKVKAALKDPEKIVIFQTAPAVRVGLGEAFGMDPGTFVEGKMVAALRTLGADYVFDTDFGADLTIMEEATELLHRLQSEEIPIPQFTAAARPGSNLPKPSTPTCSSICRRPRVLSASSARSSRPISPSRRTSTPRRSSMSASRRARPRKQKSAVLN